MRRFNRGLTTALFVLTLAAGACSSGEPIGLASPTGFVPGPPISTDGVEFELQRVLFRTSYQTYYLMSYPEQGFKFLQIVARIEGSDDPVQWGTEHLSVRDGGQEFPLAFARSVLVGEDIEYRADADFEYEYEFYYQVPADASGESLRLQFSDGRPIELAGLGNAGQVPTAVPKEGEVLSGESNLAAGLLSVIAGGSDNRTGATHAAALAGRLNLAAGDHSTVAGGRENEAYLFASTIAGGYGNLALARESSVSGGSRNTAASRYASVGGGIQNSARGSSATVAGGANNTVDAIYATIAGGIRNQALGDSSAVGGGAGNSASGSQSAVAGGLGNQAPGGYSAVLGGYGNISSGRYSAVLGGESNKAEGNWSVAGGRMVSIGPDHDGAILLGDSQPVVFESLAADEFAVRSTGGVRLITALGDDGQPAAGAILPAGSGSWVMLSDREAKAGFVAADPDVILAGVRSLSIGTWSYAAQGSSTQHIGPTAQDFYRAFEMGEDPRYIGAVDADGVALAAIQALGEQADHDRATVQDLSARVAALEYETRGFHVLGTTWQSLMLGLACAAVGYLMGKRTD